MEATVLLSPSGIAPISKDLRAAVKRFQQADGAEQGSHAAVRPPNNRLDVAAACRSFSESHLAANFAQLMSS